MVDATRLILVGLKRSPWDVWNYLGDVSYCFCPPFSEYHAGIRMKILWIFDKAKVTGGLISSAEVVFVH